MKLFLVNGNFIVHFKFIIAIITVEQNLQCFMVNFLNF